MRQDCLINPERYGLTYQEAIDLVTNGKWKNFQKQIYRRQEKLRRILAKGFICPRCNEAKEELDEWQESGKACKACDKRRGAYPVNPIHKMTLQKKEVTGSCYYCGFKRTQSKLAGKDVCRFCLRKYEDKVNAIKRSRGIK